MRCTERHATSTPSSTSTWRSTATSSSPSARSWRSSTSPSSVRSRRGSSCRRTFPTHTRRSNGCLRGRTPATPTVVPASRSGSSRAPTSRWSRWRPRCTGGRRRPTGASSTSTRRTSGCSNARCARATREPCASAWPATTCSRSRGRSPSRDIWVLATASTSRCSRGWRLRSRAPCSTWPVTSCSTRRSWRARTARRRSPTCRAASTRTRRRRTSSSHSSTSRRARRPGVASHSASARRSWPDTRSARSRTASRIVHSTGRPPLSMLPSRTPSTPTSREPGTADGSVTPSTGARCRSRG